MTFVPIEEPVFSLTNEKKRDTLFRLLKTIEHPFILPILDLDFLRERKKLVVFREISATGSIKDRLYKADPLRKSFNDKYIHRKGKRIPSKPLSVQEIKVFGFQLLQALSFLKSLNFPFPHLHSGNVILRNGKCCLTDLENSFLGLEPHDFPFEEVYTKKMNVEVLCFGNILWEMAVGFPRGNSDVTEIEDDCPPQVFEILCAIFANESAPQTVEELLIHKFFSGQKLELQPPTDINQKMISLLRKTSSSVSALLTGSPVTPQQVSTPKKKKSKSTTKPKEGTSSSAPAPPAPPTAPTAANPPAAPVTSPALSTERDSLLAALRNPANQQRLKKVE